MSSFRCCKRLLAAFLTVLVLSISIPGQLVFAEEPAVIQDIDKAHGYARASILSLAGKNIISGDNNGNFHPLDTIKRSEMAKLIVKAIGIDTAELPETPTFSDVPKGHWAFEYVEAGYKAGIIRGISEGVFGLNKECTREEMAVLFVRAAGLKDEDLRGKQPYLYISRMSDRSTISNWAIDSVEFALSAGLVNGIEARTFGAKIPAQRQQAVVMTDRFINGQEAVAKFAGAFRGDVDHPELYEALINIDKKFKGVFEMNYLIDVSSEDGESISSVNMSANGFMDMDSESQIMDMDLDYQMAIGIIGETAVDMQFRVILLNDSYYLQYGGIEEWQVLTGQDMEKLGVSVTAGANTSELVKYYRYATILEETDIEFRGKQAVKYSLFLNEAAAEVMMSGIVNGQTSAAGDVSEFYTEDLKGDIVIYLDENDRMIYQSIEFTGIVNDEEFDTDVAIKAVLNAYFGHSGDVVIAAPEINPAEAPEVEG